MAISTGAATRFRPKPTELWRQAPPATAIEAMSSGNGVMGQWTRTGARAGA